MHCQQTHPNYSSSYSKFTSQTACSKYLSGMWWIRAAFAHINKCNTISLLYLCSFQMHRLVPFLGIRKCIVVIIPGVCHATHSAYEWVCVKVNLQVPLQCSAAHLKQRRDKRALKFCFLPSISSFLFMPASAGLLHRSSSQLCRPGKNDYSAATHVPLTDNEAPCRLDVKDKLLIN